jgi:hypothetical protein
MDSRLEHSGRNLLLLVDLGSWSNWSRLFLKGPENEEDASINRWSNVKC